jgi:hypothetical protein
LFFAGISDENIFGTKVKVKTQRENVVGVEESKKRSSKMLLRIEWIIVIPRKRRRRPSPTMSRHIGIRRSIHGL